MTAVYIALSVLCATLLFVLFKVFDRQRIHTPLALVLNYLVAAAFGLFFLPSPGEFFAIYAKSWFWMSCVLGFLFISLFYLMALISQKIGVSAASVATKMSVVIPVTAAVILYGDSMTATKITGIILALIGIWLATTKGKSAIPSTSLAWLPFILFLGSGTLDTLLKFSENKLVPKADDLLFIPSIFLLAFAWGAVMLLFFPKQKAATAPRYLSWIGGILLGVVNYGSIYFIWQALAGDGVESSMVFPVANMGVVAASSMAGLLLFRERLSVKNWTGIILSLVAITLIALV